MGLGGLRLYLIDTLISLRRAPPVVIRVPPPKRSLRSVAAAAGNPAVLDNLTVEVVLLAFDYAADEGAGKIVCGLPRILLLRTRVNKYGLP